MLYSEFIENANVKDDMLSWSVYSGLHKMYMKYDVVTKEDVYKYGRTMCDDLHDVARSDIKARMDVWYHGVENYPPLSFTCGRCGCEAHADWYFCPMCGAEFIKETTGEAGEYRKGEQRNAEQKERGSKDGETDDRD